MTQTIARRGRPAWREASHAGRGDGWRGIVETWAIHNRINLYMLDAIPDEALGATASPKCRTVYELFAHIHNVRLMWLKSAAPRAARGLEKLEGEVDRDKAKLRAALEASGKAIEKMLEQGDRRRGARSRGSSRTPRPSWAT